jgi:hypothetical protein
MKKILYVCINPIKNWDIFTPSPVEGKARSTISLLLLHKEQDLEGVSVSHVWNLNESEQDCEDRNTQKSISYQGFLEEVFSHDLSMVI